MANWTHAALKAQLLQAEADGLLAILLDEADTHSLPRPYVVAIASRETNIKNILGDGGHGHGVLQIDDRFHKAEIDAHPDWKTNARPLVAYGCGLLQANVKQSKNTFPGRDDNAHLKVAASGYNAGMSRAIKDSQQVGDSDAHTANHDYGKDVMARMIVFAELLA